MLRATTKWLLQWMADGKAALQARAALKKGVGE
jgi:hypothetical protein